METTESTSVPLENQNSETFSQVVNSLSRTTHDVEVQTVGNDQVVSVNKSESKQNKILRIVKVFKNLKKTQDNNDSKQLKKIRRLKNVKSTVCVKTSKRKDKTSKIGSFGKKSNNKSSKVGDTLENEQDSSEKRAMLKEQKDNKGATPKKNPDERVRYMSKPTKELLLSEHVTLSRDWTANRKTYTRSNIALSAKAANDYDALTQKSEKIESEHAIETASELSDASVVKKSDIDESSRHQLSDNCTNNRIESDSPTSTSIQKTAHSEEDSCNLNENESNSNNLHESSSSQNSGKTTILKQKKTKGKRKSVHFSDKIDLPIDCLNRNDILLEIDDVTAKSHEKDIKHFSDVSVNDVATTPCIVNGHSVPNKNISTGNQRSLNNLSTVSADDALIASIEIDKIQCPIKEGSKCKKNLLKAKNQEGNLDNLNNISTSEQGDISIKMRQPKCKMYTKTLQKRSNVEVHIIKSSDTTKQDTTKENIIKRKRGRPRKVDITQHKNENLLKTKMLTMAANSENKEGSVAAPSKSVCRRRKRKIDVRKLVAARRLQRQDRTVGDKTQSAAITVGAETICSQQPIKRKRGRPRKYPLEHNSCDVNSPLAKKTKLDHLEVASKNEKEMLGTTDNDTLNKENEQRNLTDALASHDETVKVEKHSQDDSRTPVPCEGSIPKELTPDSNGNATKPKVLEELPLKQKSDDDNSDVLGSKENQSIEISCEIVSDAQSQNGVSAPIMKSGSLVTEVVSEPNIGKQEVQMQEVQISEMQNALVCPKAMSKDNETVKLNLDVNSLSDKSKEQAVQCTEIHNVGASETLFHSGEGSIESSSSLCKTHKKQRLKGLVKVTDVNTDEDQHSKQENLGKNDSQALHKLNNHKADTLEGKGRQKQLNSARFILSETTCDKDQANDLITERKHRKRRKKTANVKLLLRKLRPVPRKTKRKKRVTFSKSEKMTFPKPDASKNSVAKDQNTMRTFVCGVCRQVYDSFREVNHHIMSFHNGLARINDDTPFSTKEEISAFAQTLKKMKKLQCLQPGCGKKFISIGGYKYHRENCGVEVPKATCEICKRVLKAANLENHMLQMHADYNDHDKQNVVEQKREGEETPEGTGDELPRRGAAVKALKKMENFMKTQKFSLEENEPGKEDELDDDSVTDSDYQESDFSEENNDGHISEKPENFSVEKLDSWKGNFKTPADVAEEICQEMTESWEKTLTENGKLKCVKKNCNKEFTALSEMKSHLQHCKARIWICSLCNRTYLKGLLLYNHMRKSHQIDDSGKSSGDVPRRSSYSYISNLVGTSFDHSGSSKLLKPFLPAVEWTMEFRKKHHKNELFSQWKPLSTNWIQMKAQNYSEYLPPLKESAFIKSLSENSPGWTRIGLFECPRWADKERQKTFFVGGSVWGSAWCPTGSTFNAIQFLALSANNPAPHSLSDCSSQKGLIQLWDMGNLGTRASSTPKLTLAIAHENGSIWDMEWCPSGCWEEASDIQNEKKPDGVLPRLGLLAVACSNSTARIYSIPHPHSVVKAAQSLPIFKCRPIVVLLCPESAPNVNCQRTLCTKVSWQKTNGHSCLAAGFGNGLVCLWNLTSSSPLLIVSHFGGQLTLRPYLSFPAHGACITGLVWIPVPDGQYLSTASYDRSVKVWNLEDHNWPQLLTKRGLITDITWLPYWCGVFASLDDCYNLQHTSTFYKECGYYSFGPKSLSTHLGCIWSLSVSDWLNVEASGDAGGEVIATVLCQLMKLVDAIKLMSHRRVPLFRITMEALGSSDEKQTESVQEVPTESNIESAKEVITENNTESGDSSGNKEKPMQQHPNQKDHSRTNLDKTSYHSYEEAVEKFGLVLIDNNMENFSAIPENEYKRVRQPETRSSYALDQYPLNSINKVSWNPNLGSHLWLFSAGQAGIARVCCVFGLQSDNLRNTVNKCKEKLRTAVDEL